MCERGVTIAAIHGGSLVAINGGIGDVEGTRAMDFLGAEYIHGYCLRYYYYELVQCIQQICCFFGG